METKTIKNNEQSTSKTIRISGSEAVVRSLIAEGVDVLYGYPGGAIMPVYDELYKFQNEMSLKSHFFSRAIPRKSMTTHGSMIALVY